MNVTGRGTCRVFRIWARAASTARSTYTSAGCVPRRTAMLAKRWDSAKPAAIPSVLLAKKSLSARAVPGWHASNATPHSSVAIVERTFAQCVKWKSTTRKLKRKRGADGR